MHYTESWSFEVSFTSTEVEVNKEMVGERGDERKEGTERVDISLPYSSETISNLIIEAQSNWESFFESSFGLEASGLWTLKELSFAKAVWGNLIGGIGFFRGDWLMDQGGGNEFSGDSELEEEEVLEGEDLVEEAEESFEGKDEKRYNWEFL